MPKSKSTLEEIADDIMNSVYLRSSETKKVTYKGVSGLTRSDLDTILLCLGHYEHGVSISEMVAPGGKVAQVLTKLGIQ